MPGFLGRWLGWLRARPAVPHDARDAGDEGEHADERADAPAGPALSQGAQRLLEELGRALAGVSWAPGVPSALVSEQLRWFDGSRGVPPELVAWFTLHDGSIAVENEEPEAFSVAASMAWQNRLLKSTDPVDQHFEVRTNWLPLATLCRRVDGQVIRDLVIFDGGARSPGLVVRYGDRREEYVKDLEHAVPVDALLRRLGELDVSAPLARLGFEPPWLK